MDPNQIRNVDFHQYELAYEESKPYHQFYSTLQGSKYIMAFVAIYTHTDEHCFDIMFVFLIAPNLSTHTPSTILCLCIQVLKTVVAELIIIFISMCALDG